MKKTFGDRVFDICNVLIMVALLIVFLWPLWFVIIASISDPKAVLNGEVLLWPKDITLIGFKKILQYDQIWVGYGNSIFYTVAGTIVSLTLSVCMAYPMSVKTFGPRKYLMVFFMITMYFNGGLIPTFLLMKNLHVLNTRFAMLLPGLISVYNCLIIRSYFMNSIPGELQEAATLDGAGQGAYLVKVVVPLSKPVFSVVGLYYAVAYWNNYTKGLYYIYDRKLLPLQNILRDLLTSSRMAQDMAEDAEAMKQAVEVAQSMKYGVIIAAALPMMILYPFIQKHFVKGVMVGAVKG